MTRAMFAGTMLALAMVARPAFADAKGQVAMKGAVFTVADAVAYQAAPGIHVAFLSTPLDRKAAATDLKLDSMDVMRGGAPHVVLHIFENGSLGCIDYAANPGAGTLCSDDHTKGLTLTALTPERVAGAFRFQGDGDSADVTFDLKVEATLERGGTALPADGGAPGRVVMAHFAAMEKGDLAALRATEPPESRAKRAAADPMVSKEMLQMMSAMAPRNVKIAGGSVDGDDAVVEFAGVVGGKAATGFVNCVQIAGAWYVTSVHTRM